MGLPWLDTPVLLHSSRADTCKLTAAQCEYRSGHWRYWYQADNVFGHATVYFMCAVIALFTLLHIASKLSLRSSHESSRPLLRIVAGGRWLAFKVFYVRRLGWYSPSVGVMALGVIGAVYFLALTLGPQPYYWPNTKTVSFGGSPPIATRAGFMAVALLPFVMIVASKANYITYLTGISHEKLQVFHRFISWTMFVLALVHTFPFIIVHIRKGDMMLQWKTDVVYWTGVAALVPQAWLNIMSIGIIRNRYYEFFKATHYFAIIFFLFFLFFFFIHCDFRLSSWDYFIAALALYLPTVAFSVVRTIRNSTSSHAILTLHSDGTIQVTISTKTTWAPGQHVFLRFRTAGVHVLTTHPFTIGSLPSSKQDTDNEMVFYIRPAGGFTARLHALAREKSTASIGVFVDGPYGKSDVASRPTASSTALLIGGGSGSSFILPLLESVLASSSLQREEARTKIQAVAAYRTMESARWFLETTERILESAGTATMNVSVDVYITDCTCPKIVDSKTAHVCRYDISTEDEKLIPPPRTAAVAKLSSINIHPAPGRPDLTRIVLDSTDTGLTVGVVVCGPASMILDVKSASAEAQGKILSGKSDGASDVWLHTESFSW